MSLQDNDKRNDSVHTRDSIVVSKDVIPVQQTREMEEVTCSQGENHLLQSLLLRSDCCNSQFVSTAVNNIKVLFRIISILSLVNDINILDSI